MKHSRFAFRAQSAPESARRAEERIDFQDARRKGASVLVGVILLQAALAGSYLAAFHSPTAHRVPVAVVGSPRLAAAVTSKSRGALTAENVATVGEAKQQILGQNVYAAYVPGRPATVLVASASSESLATSLPESFYAVSKQLGTTQRVVDLAPLPAGDPGGLSIFYLGFSWVFGAYLAAVALNAIRGDRRFYRRDASGRLIGLLWFSFVGGLITSTIACFGVGAFASGDYWQLVGLGTLTGFAVSMVASALISLFGTLGTALVIVLFVIVGTPASDGTFAIQLTGSGPWRWLTDVLPTGVAVRAIRSGVYLAGTNLAQYVLILVAYVATGGIVLLGLGVRNSSIGYAEPSPDQAAP